MFFYTQMITQLPIVRRKFTDSTELYHTVQKQLKIASDVNHTHTLDTDVVAVSFQL